MAIGSIRLSSQAGPGISGSTSVRCRIISKDTEPEPMITPASKASAGTGPSSSTWLTCSRERMWSDSSSIALSGCRPPR